MGNAPRKWTDKETAQLKKLHAEGNSCHAIAKEMGWAKSTISSWATKLGLDFERESTAKAVEAFVLDRKLTRAQIIDSLYERSQYLLTQLNATRTDGGKYRTLVPVGGGSQASMDLNHVPASDERNIANSISSYLAKAEALEKIDSDGGLNEAKSLLGGIAQAIQDSVQGKPRLNK
jgi:prefoldin subunit 5